MKKGPLYVSQLAEWMLPIPEGSGSIPVIGNFNRTFGWSIGSKACLNTTV